MSSCPMLHHLCHRTKIGPITHKRWISVYCISNIRDSCRRVRLQGNVRTSTYKITMEHRIDQQTHRFPIRFRVSKKKDQVMPRYLHIHQPSSNHTPKIYKHCTTSNKQFKQKKSHRREKWTPDKSLLHRVRRTPERKIPL